MSDMKELPDSGFQNFLSSSEGTLALKTKLIGSIFSNGLTWTNTEMQSNKPHPAKLRRGLKGLKFNIVANLKM